MPRPLRLECFLGTCICIRYLNYLFIVKLYDALSIICLDAGIMSLSTLETTNIVDIIPTHRNLRVGKRLKRLEFAYSQSLNGTPFSQSAQKPLAVIIVL